MVPNTFEEIDALLASMVAEYSEKTYAGIEALFYKPSPLPKNIYAPFRDDPRPETLRIVPTFGMKGTAPSRRYVVWASGDHFVLVDTGRLIDGNGDSRKRKPHQLKRYADSVEADKVAARLNAGESLEAVGIGRKESAPDARTVCGCSVREIGRCSGRKCGKERNR